MPQIKLLSEETIEKIAAGEVVERPASVVKELVENAIDAKSTFITVEIKEGGISLIRITDNGCGIEKEQVPIAFLRHSTSKIRSIEDLMNIHSLGFRGEALSSISAVAQVELITRTRESITGTRYQIEGSREQNLEEIGAPEGTTFLVRNLFFNTPARRKFLKSPQTEAGYISSLMERLALSHPEISFQFIQNNQTKLHTNGNGNQKDIIYHIYGREIATNLLPVKCENEFLKLTGFLGKPLISRGNRNFENYYINGRYVKSNLIARAIEEAYHPFMMQHQYPFTVLYFEIEEDLLDVNVHPTKMELRFSNQDHLYEFLVRELRGVLQQKSLIPDVSLEQNKKPEARIIQKHGPEPFEIQRREKEFSQQEVLQKTEAAQRPEVIVPPQAEPVEKSIATPQAEPVEKSIAPPQAEPVEKSIATPQAEPVEKSIAPPQAEPVEKSIAPPQAEPVEKSIAPPQTSPVSKEVLTSKTNQQLTMLDVLQEEQAYETDFFREVQKQNFRLIGQLFDTYWLVEVENQLFIIDQHAAHEKVLFERNMKAFQKRSFYSQQLSPPIIMTLTLQEQNILMEHMDEFTGLGFEISGFGGNEFSVSAVPDNLYQLDPQELFTELLDDMTVDAGRLTPEMVWNKLASVSCKAAVKGNQKISRQEMEHLIEELLGLENPYHCPHGRPTIITMTRYEIEKKFKRIV